MKKTERVYIRLSKEEKQKLQKKADKIGVNLSEFIREIALKKDVIFIDNSVEKQIRKIGYNVNQIVKVSHTYKVPPSENILKEIEELKKMIIDLTNKSKSVKK